MASKWKRLRARGGVVVLSLSPRADGLFRVRVRVRRRGKGAFWDTTAPPATLGPWPPADARPQHKKNRLVPLHRLAAPVRARVGYYRLMRASDAAGQKMGPPLNPMRPVQGLGNRPKNRRHVRAPKSSEQFNQSIDGRATTLTITTTGPSHHELDGNKKRLAAAQQPRRPSRWTSARARARTAAAPSGELSGVRPPLRGRPCRPWPPRAVGSGRRSSRRASGTLAVPRLPRRLGQLAGPS